MFASLVKCCFALLAVIAAIFNSVVVQDRDGYVQVEGDQPVLALRGVLLRVQVGKITTSDGFKTTVYRDVDYPIRRSRTQTTPKMLSSRYSWVRATTIRRCRAKLRRPRGSVGRSSEPITYSGKIMFRDAEEFEVKLKLDYSGNHVRVSEGQFLDVENGVVEIARVRNQKATLRFHGFTPSRRLCDRPRAGLAA